jgi:hypothetical protein
MTPDRRGTAIVEFPNDLEVLVTRKFDAPIELLFDVLTKPQHVRKHIAPFGEAVTVCDIDLRVGGSYHIVFVTSDGIECSFRGTYLEVERQPGPSRHGISTGGRTRKRSRRWTCRRPTGSRR